MASWWKKLIHIGAAVTKIAAPKSKATVATEIISTVVTEGTSAENAAATLLLTAIEKKADQPNIRAIALKVHDLTMHVYQDDPAFKPAPPFPLSTSRR